MGIENSFVENFTKTPNFKGQHRQIKENVPELLMKLKVFWVTACEGTAGTL